MVLSSFLFSSNLYLCKSMKYPIVLLFITALFLQSFSRTLVMADYLVNLEAYKEKCINKVRPKLNCNGKCQLYKKINQQDQNKDMQAPVYNQADFVLSSKTYFPSLHLHTVEQNRSFPLFAGQFVASNYIDAIFHPPGLLIA